MYIAIINNLSGTGDIFINPNINYKKIFEISDIPDLNENLKNPNFFISEIKKLLKRKFSKNKKIIIDIYSGDGGITTVMNVLQKLHYDCDFDFYFKCKNILVRIPKHNSRKYGGSLKWTSRIIHRQQKLNFLKIKINNEIEIFSPTNISGGYFAHSQKKVEFFRSKFKLPFFKIFNIIFRILISYFLENFHFRKNIFIFSEKSLNKHFIVFLKDSRQDFLFIKSTNFLFFIFKFLFSLVFLQPCTCKKMKTKIKFSSIKSDILVIAGEILKIPRKSSIEISQEKSFFTVDFIDIK